jgi:hypothetical protein
MTTKTRYSHGNDHRLVISTICTHLVAFHEAGFEFRTERKQQVTVVAWNPFTWGGGYEWRKSNSAEQPSILEYSFIQGTDIVRSPADFAVTETRNTGSFKSSCSYLFGGISNDSRTNPVDPPDDLGNDARSVNDVVVRYRYNGQDRTIRHSSG